MTLLDHLVARSPELGDREALGSGCSYCAEQNPTPENSNLSMLPPNKAALWNTHRNGGLTPSDVTAGSHRKVWWQCGKGHEWQAAVYSVVKGDGGCPYCSGRKAIIGETDLATTHPHIAALWSEQNELTPDSLPAGSHKKVWWRCERGHAWQAQVSAVALDGNGCPYCAGRRAIPGETDLATVCPDIALQWDTERNGTLTPDLVLPSGHDKVWWRCDKGHSWQAVIFSRTGKKGGGCPYCTGRKVLAGFNDLATVKPRLAKEWYQPLNGALQPTEVSAGSNKRVWWQCAERHVWQAAIYARTRRRGSGCPVCAGTVKKSGAAQSVEIAPAVKKRRTGAPNPVNYINV